MFDEKKPYLTFAATGDISPNRDDPASIFKYSRDVLSKADVVFGQLESPMSEKGTAGFNTGTSQCLPSASIQALTEKGGGFDVMSFACNHSMHWGQEAFLDTIQNVEATGVKIVGAGKDIDRARQAIIVEKDGTKFGFLASLSIVFPGLIADIGVPGSNPLRAHNWYRQVDFQPGTPPAIMTQLYEEDKANLIEDIKKLRPQVDIVVVSMHAGVHIEAATIAMYQKEAAHTAIDNGADIVLMHHAHILKGIEVYKGKAIFYGLGNFAVEHMQPRSDYSKGRKLDRPWRRDANSADFHSRTFYKVKPTPGYPRHVFPEDSLKTMIVKAYVQDKKIQKVTYVPAFITTNLEPEVVKRDNPKAQQVFDYVTEISAHEDLPVAFKWDGDEVLVSEGKAPDKNYVH